MKNFIKILIFSCLAFTLQDSIRAQSSLVTFSPSSSTLISGASRCGYNYGNWASYYMRYNDSSYYCIMHYPVIALPSPNSTKIQIPQDFVITDFKELWYRSAFIGSYQGVGMYGWAGYYNYAPQPINFFQLIKLPAVDQLTRTAYYMVSNGEYDFNKACSIGDRRVSFGVSRQSYILDYFVDVGSQMGPYYYAPLAYDPSTGEQEIADDVIIIDNYVVVATRDSRSDHAPVNLRISDTSELLSANPEIDFQWQFLLPSYENVVSEIRMIPIKKDIFVLAYTIFDDIRSDYFLCTHLISLYDFLSGYNTIVSHEISSVKQCPNLIEMVYEPDVNTMIILLNGNEKSELYHVDPITATSTIASKLDYPNGLLHSLDVIQQYFSSNADKYMAMGDSVLFFQDISNGINIDYSCLQISPVKYFLVDPPSIDLFLDPLERYSDQKTYAQISKNPIYFEGVKTCDITENKNTK